MYDLYDLYDLARAAAWESYNRQDLAHVSWIGFVLREADRSCTTSDDVRLGSRLEDLDHRIYSR